MESLNNYIGILRFGLQEVDNLKPSKYMIDLATENIDRKKTYDDVEKEIKEYYNAPSSDQKII